MTSVSLSSILGLMPTTHTLPDSLADLISIQKTTDNRHWLVLMWTADGDARTIARCTSCNEASRMAETIKTVLRTW